MDSQDVLYTVALIGGIVSIFMILLVGADFLIGFGINRRMKGMRIMRKKNDIVRKAYEAVGMSMPGEYEMTREESDALRDYLKRNAMVESSIRMAVGVIQRAETEYQHNHDVIDGIMKGIVERQGGSYPMRGSYRLDHSGLKIYEPGVMIDE